MNPEFLAKRYRYLWTGEATSAVLFSLILLFWALIDGQWQNWIVRTYSLAIVVSILTQAVFWWQCKLRLLQQGQRKMQAATIQRYRRFKLINWILIGAFPLVLLAKQSLTGELFASRDTWFGLLILLGAVLEQINYYHIQLMYDSRYDWEYLRQHRRLRPGSIGKVIAGST